MNPYHSLRIGDTLERALLSTGGKVCTAQMEALFPSWMFLDFFDFNLAREHHVVFRSARGLTPHALLIVSAARIMRTADRYGVIHRITFLSNAKSRLMLANIERIAREIWVEADEGGAECWPAVCDRFSASPGRRPVEVH